MVAKSAVFKFAIVLTVSFSCAPCFACVVFHGLDSKLSWKELANEDNIVVADLSPSGPPTGAELVWTATRDLLVTETQGIWHSGSILFDEYLPPAYNSPQCDNPMILQVVEVLKGPASLLRRDFRVCELSSRSPKQRSGRQVVFLDQRRFSVGSLWHDTGGIPELSSAVLSSIREACELQATGQTENRDVVSWTVTALSRPGVRDRIKLSVVAEDPLTAEQQELIIQSIFENPPDRFVLLFVMTSFFSKSGSPRVVDLLTSLIEACQGEPENLAFQLREYRASNIRNGNAAVARARYVEAILGSKLCEQYRSTDRYAGMWQDLLSDLPSR